VKPTPRTQLRSRYNVLEHIEDDVAALDSMRRLVRVGGYVAVIVPAFEIGMSDFDRRIGHFRRYQTGMVAERMRAAGLEPVSVRYINFVGLVMWVLLVRFPPPSTAQLGGTAPL